jgi:hypothetical protein
MIEWVLFEDWSKAQRAQGDGNYHALRATKSTLHARGKRILAYAMKVDPAPSIAPCFAPQLPKS